MMRRITLHMAASRGWSRHRGTVALPVGFCSRKTGYVEDLLDLGGQF